MTRNNLLSALILLGLHTFAWGQNVVLSVGSSTAAAGGTVTLPVTVASTSGAQTTGLQWTFSYSADVTGVTLAAGTSTTNAGKSISCSGNRCLIAGINSTVISDGTVALATFQIAANPSNNPITIQLTSVVATTAGGSSILSSGGSGTISLPAVVALSSLNCANSTINTPGNTSCTVALTGAASGTGFSVSLSSNNSSLTVPPSVTVAAGQTSNSFTATGAQVSSNQTGVVTASAGGVNLTSTLSLVAPARLSSLTCGPSTLGSTASSTCTVTLNKTATSAAGVSLASNNGLLTVPANVTVASGQSSATFLATSGTVSSSQSAIVTAILNGQSQQATISLAAAAQLSGLNCSPATVNAPGASTCTVNLTAPASSAASVTLLSNNVNVTVPTSFNIGAGLSSATFTATVAAVTSDQTALLTGTLNSTSQSFTLAVSAPAQPTSVGCAPSTLGSNSSSTCTVTLNKAAASAATVSLASNNGFLTVPANVTVASGQGSATFTASSGTVSNSQSVIVTATLSGQSQQATISLAAASQLSSLSCAQATVNAPGTSTCTVNLTAVASSAASVTLLSNNGTVSVPASVNIGAGLNSATFTATVPAASTDQIALLTATLNGTSQSFTLAVSAPAQLTSIGCAPSTLGSNASSTCTAMLNKAATSAAMISLSSNSGLLTVPASVTVGSGQSSATFTANSGSVSSSQSAIVTATLSGLSQQSTISLAAASQLSSLTCSVVTVNAPGTSTCSVNLTAAALSAASVTLLSDNSNVTVPASVNIGAGLSSAAFTATVAAVSSDQTALLTGILNGVSQSFTLAASAPPRITSIACAPSALGSNATSTCTVTLNKNATSVSAISLASNSGIIAVPANLMVAPGANSATFPATSGTVSGSQSAIVAATLNGQSQQATISLAAAAQLSSITCSSATLNAPDASTCTVNLNTAASSAASVALLSNNISVTVPASVNIGAGLNSATFTAAVSAVTSDQTALLTATLNGISQSFTLTAKNSTTRRPTSVFCSPSAMTSRVSAKCAVSLDAAATIDSVLVLSSSSPLLSVPATVTIPAGQSSAAFDAISGSINTSQNVTVMAALNGQSQQTTITLAAAVDCQEFQTSPGGLCMIQDVFPWITFGGGWESRLKAGNLSNAIGGGTIQFSFTLLPSVPITGGVQNHMPAYFNSSLTGQTQMGETATYTLSAGESVAVDFQAPAGGCDIHGQNCGSLPDPNTSAYGSVLVQYVADNPASLRGIAKAQLALLANVANADYGWQTTEREMPAANLWTAPVAVSANPGANPQVNQQASAALANPGPAAITVRGTLYDKNGLSVTFRDFQVPARGAIASVFSQDPSQPFGGFGQAMFPFGQDFNGLVAFQVISPSGGSMAAMVLQDVGNAVSSVEVNSQGVSAANSSSTSTTRCAEFAMAVDGTCSVQYMLPWVVFGGGWESRLKAGNPPSPTSGAVQLRFSLLPAASPANGLRNHLPAYFTDNRTGQLQVGESANYTLSAGQSVDVHFLYPPAGCDGNGQNCASQPDPNTLSFGSVLVQYSSFDPATLRRQANPQLAFLARPSGAAYSSQITERAAGAANTWTAPVALSADPNANPQSYQQASAAITNPGSTPVTVRGTLRDQNGNVVTYNDFQIPAFSAAGIVFSRDSAQPFGGFGNAAFPQGQNFNGWVTFDVTSQGNSGVSVLVLQYVGSTISSVNAQPLQ